MPTPHHLSIRQLTAADAEAFSALRRAVTADNPVPMGLTLEEELARPLQGFRDQLSYPEPNAAFGAFAGGELIGSAAVAWPSKLASSRHKVNLWGVFVSPHHRRQGVGRALLVRALEHTAAHGVRRVNLTVYLPNAPAIALYESLGFAQCGVEPQAVCLDDAFHDGCQMSLQQNGAHCASTTETLASAPPMANSSQSRETPHMTLLTPMTEPEFAAYLEIAIPDFARSKVASGQWSEIESLALSRQDYAQLLPQGLATTGNFLYTVRDAATQAPVGILWFAAQERGGKQIAFVYDIEIVAEHQRRGHASRAFAALEDEVRRLGLAGVALHVFGSNSGALALYHRLGFQTTNVNMFKPVSGTGDETPV